MRVPKLSMEILAAVVAAADRKSLRLAARDLGLTPSAVFKRIDRANETLGTPLFVSTENGIVLTSAGVGFYRDALCVIEHGLLAEDKLAARLQLEHGQLLVGRSAYLPPMLMANVMRVGSEPRLSSQIQQIPGLTPALVRRVAEATMHAGFGELPIQRPELLARVLWEEPILVCMPLKHPLALKSTLRPDDLRREPVIAVGQELWPRLHDEVAEFFRSFGIELRIVADAFGSHEAVVMVEHGIGICMLPASHISKPVLVGKTLSPQALSQKYAVFVREDNDHPNLQAFVNLVLERCNKRHR